VISSPPGAIQPDLPRARIAEDFAGQRREAERIVVDLFAATGLLCRQDGRRRQRQLRRRRRHCIYPLGNPGPVAPICGALSVLRWERATTRPSTAGRSHSAR